MITELNGKKINSFSELRAKVATSGPGTEIELTYLRDGKEEKAKVTLQSDGVDNTAKIAKFSQSNNQRYYSGFKRCRIC
ncbi:serine protease [Actinobacillus equuli]|nr:serine protease [Actinobacillus equuli]